MQTLFAPVKARSPLEKHRLLSPTAGIRVSPLCLGTMNFGDAWKEFMGECSKETAFEMLDYFYESGGNFLDTANGYQNEESEIWLGEWMEARGVRDEMVVATKYSINYKRGQQDGKSMLGNYSGNAAKSLHLSLEASLKKLKTSYIDILYIHWWDGATSVEEMMQTLNHAVRSGKVLYLGISDTPAWVVSKANQYARDHGMSQFVLYQGHWSAAEREFERDILPMCEAEGMSMAPWGVLGRGHFKTAEQRAADTPGRQMGGESDNSQRVSVALERIATARGTLMTSVAIAYVMAASPYRVFPIVGGRSVKHLKGNVEALELKLTLAEMEEIEKATGFNYGFPVSMMHGPAAVNTRYTAGTNFIAKSAVELDVEPKLSTLVLNSK